MSFATLYITLWANVLENEIFAVVEKYLLLKRMEIEVSAIARLA